MESYVTDDIIYALATGWVKSALAIIRISGEGCIDALSTHFSRPEALSQASSSTLVHGLLFSEKKEEIDEVVVGVYRDTHGYTGEEALEISCHGSLVGLKKILSLCNDLGFRPAAGGEFTYRAFLHGRMDLTQSEAVAELIDSQSDISQSLALKRLNGVLKKRLLALREQFLTVMATIEVQLDYSEDELDEFTFPTTALQEIADSMQRIASTYQTGKLYGEGAKIVLAGSTNVGKSSLFNLLLRQQRSIVSPIAGTTRDYIQETCVIEGIPVRLFDTAGLRESQDEIEEEGVRRTRTLIKDADLVVYLLDEGEQPPPRDKRTLVVTSKSDLHQSPSPAGLCISSVTGEGVEVLLKTIGAHLKENLPSIEDQEVVIQSLRQHDLLLNSEKAIESALVLQNQGVPLDIIASVLQDGLQSLGEITGAVTAEDILQKIFSGFCVGK